MKTEFQTHDLNLPAWGPYTKKYSGISHIPKANDGVRFDLAVFPGLYRRRVDVPDGISSQPVLAHCAALRKLLPPRNPDNRL